MCLCLKGVWRNNCLFDLIIFLVRIMIILVYFIYNLFSQCPEDWHLHIYSIWQLHNKQSTQNRTFPHDLCVFFCFVSLFRKQNVQSGGLPVPWVAHVHPWALEVWRGQRLSWWGRRERQSWLWWDWTGLIVHCCPSHCTHWLFRHNHPPFIPIQIHQLLVSTRCKGCWNGSFPLHSFQFSYYRPRLDFALVVPHKSWLSPQLLCSGQSKVAVTACPISGLLALCWQNIFDLTRTRLEPRCSVAFSCFVNIAS